MHTLITRREKMINNARFYFNYEGDHIEWTYKGSMDDDKSPLYRAYKHATYKPRLNDFKIIDPKNHNITNIKKALLADINEQPKEKPKTIWGR